MSSPSINTSTTDRLLFGHSQPWPSFHAVDDRVRGGASQSYFETTGSNGARFCGHLGRFSNLLLHLFHEQDSLSDLTDITALGGAGFASQCSALGSAPLRLSPEKFDGIKITVARPLHLSAGTPTAFVLSLKNELPGHRQDGRRESVTTYEFAFDLDELTPIKNEKAPLLEKAGAQVELLARWSDFKATYRGRPAEGAPPMDSTEIRECVLRSHCPFEYN